MKISIVFTLLCSLIAFNMHADETFQDPATGVVFPRQVTFQHQDKTYQLNATGVTTRKKFVVKVYSIASYLQAGAQVDPSNKFQALLSDQNAKQLTIKWVHDVDVDKIQEAFMDAFKVALTDAEQQTLQNEIQTFLHFFNQPVKKGDEHILRSLPGGSLEVLLNGKSVGSLTNKDFAKGVWSIWLGPNTNFKRDELVSLLNP